jgi:ankyrin repeat protein
MSASLPPRPSLEWLRKTAKDHLSHLRRTDPAARLADAQLALARMYGFPSWRQLKAYVEGTSRQSRQPAADEAVREFFRHVGTGRIAEVRALLAESPQLVNAIGPHPFWGGRPQPLHVAIETRRHDMFELLLQAGADVNGSNGEYDYWSPLMLAVNQPAMRDELLRRGARIGLVEALMLADDARVEELLRPGSLPAVVPNGGSILAFARTPFAIDRLIDLGAPTDQQDRWGTTPIDAMSHLGARGQALVRHMIARGVPAAPKEYARSGDLAVLSRLVESDAAVARLDSVMMAAVEGGHHTLVEWLLERGGNVNARSDAEPRHTALHSAAWNGDLEMVKLLINAGADRTARDEKHDATPQGWAETSILMSNNPKCAEVVEYLEAMNNRHAPE